MATAEQVHRWSRDLGEWAAMLERAATNCRWLLARQDPPLPPVMEDNCRARLLEVERMAGEFRAEQAMWARLEQEHPAILNPASRAGRQIRAALARWERDLVV
jgi:hypothetical protein